MTKNVTIAGANYNAVPGVTLNVQDGGTAYFPDTSDADATAGDIASGKTAYVNGTKITGTGSGGGGGGGATPVETGVQFIDYDGTLVETWESADVAGKSALPSNPSHTGLTAQGWNWTLANIKSYIQSYPSALLTVGQMYVTSSGATEIDITLAKGRLSPYLGIAVNGSVDVDWGDGSAHSTVTGSSLTTQVRTLHNYATAGNYTIKVTVNSGSYALHTANSTNPLLNNNATTAARNRVYSNAVREVRVGNNVTIGNYAFSYCYSLRSVSLPSTITTMGDNAFQYCYSVEAVVLPLNITSLPTYIFYYCESLQHIAIPHGVTVIGTYAFYNCFSFPVVALPPSMTSIKQNCFNYCYSLERVTIPSTVNTIETNAFAYANSLRSVSVTSNLSTLGASAFNSCYSLPEISLGQVTTITSSCCGSMYSLASITIPSTVTLIESSALGTCYGLGEIHFQATSPATVSNSNAFSNLPTDCKICVPTGYLSAYTTASNYPSSLTYTYIEE